MFGSIVINVVGLNLQHSAFAIISRSCNTRVVFYALPLPHLPILFSRNLCPNTSLTSATRFIAPISFKRLRQDSDEVQLYKIVHNSFPCIRLHTRCLLSRDRLHERRSISYICTLNSSFQIMQTVLPLSIGSESLYTGRESTGTVP